MSKLDGYKFYLASAAAAFCIAAGEGLRDAQGAINWDTLFHISEVAMLSAARSTAAKFLAKGH